MSLESEVVVEAFKGVQDAICDFLTNSTGQVFLEDPWEYEKGRGGGRTRVLEAKGAEDVIEKGGVNFSAIEGDTLPQAATSAHKLPGDVGFLATGVSIVLHPHNPHVPTIHMNVRYFLTGDKWWFGGGIDLTPYYPQKHQVIAFHKLLREVCQRHDQPYDTYKATCDTYFYLPHRNESRGVGGIFFDQLSTSTSPLSAQALLDFVCDLGMSFIELYRPFVERNVTLTFTEAHREFQLIRRARYVEFNLLWDRGTKFGIESNGRTESILMSMPATAIWRYNYTPAPGSEEESIVQFYFQAQDWVHLEESNGLEGAV
jgi:coproporphyrinogen III oxidase